MSKDMVYVEGISKQFKQGTQTVQALEDINLSISAASLNALKGRSGSGKTTMLNILGTLDRPTKGKFFFQNKEMTSLKEKERTIIRRRDIGLVFQSNALVSYLTAYENVEFGLRISGVSPSEYKIRVEEALEFVGLQNRMQHYPHEMSGGEQQRVGIARAIAHKPKLLLADEPTANLDSKMGFQVLHLFKDLVRNEGVTIIITTHDPAMMELADQIFALEDGRLVYQS